MEKFVSELKSREKPVEVSVERLLKRDWYSLGARSPYWTGSPWRAMGMLFQDLTP